MRVCVCVCACVCVCVYIVVERDFLIFSLFALPQGIHRHHLPRRALERHVFPFPRPGVCLFLPVPEGERDTYLEWGGKSDHFFLYGSDVALLLTSVMLKRLEIQCALNTPKVASGCNSCKWSILSGVTHAMADNSWPAPSPPPQNIEFSAEGSHMCPLTLRPRASHLSLTIEMNSVSSVQARLRRHQGPPCQ
jgi:hypothetical protein